MDYPGLAKAIVASVVASVSYSLWTSRRSSRTRQSLVISSAAASRIVARDDAAYVQLFDGACRSLAEAVTTEYTARLRKSKNGENKTSRSNLDDLSSLDDTHPVKIALDLGLMKEGASTRELVVVDMTAASSEFRHSWAQPTPSTK
jgi:hypothetical protein